MPSSAQEKAAPHRPPAIPDQNGESSTSNRISLQPSPAVISSSSHVTQHVLARRFLGPMPEHIINSDAVEAQRRTFRDLRRKALHKVIGDAEGGAGGFGTVDNRKGVRKVAHRIRVRTKGAFGEDEEEEMELDGDDSDSDEGPDGVGLARLRRISSKKKKKTRKDVWVGESFDIGRQFRKVKPREDGEGEEEEEPHGGLEQGGPLENNNLISGSDEGQELDGRPHASRHTTQETFVTARTHAASTRSSLIPHLDVPGANGNARRPAPSDSSSLLQQPMMDAQTRNSMGSSVAPLISVGDSHNGKGKGMGMEGSIAPSTAKTAPANLRSRLKSAMRKPSIPRAPSISPTTGQVDRVIAKTDTGVTASKTRNGNLKSKSVQFPMDPVQIYGSGEDAILHEPPRKGNKQPAHPKEVLSREGDAVAGTSAGAVDAALEEADEEEESFTVGDIILRDRMLVRIGHHREERMENVDEAKLRDHRCQRIVRMEEYIVVLRQGFVEFYQDYKLPFKERYYGIKRECFRVPLVSKYTTLSVFNPSDMTICLATSTEGSLRVIKDLLRSRSSSAANLKEQVKNSRQSKWLRLGQKGTHLFIMKLGERSRAVDWYWEIWKELGGQLPSRLDIHVPVLSTSIRLSIPEDEEEVGGKATRALLKPSAVLATAWEMLTATLTNDEVGNESRRRGIGLVWKTADGRLDWLTHDTTVQNKPRDWGILSGLIRQVGPTGQVTQELQMRSGQHRAAEVKLEDGTKLQEPIGVEGYLIRHKTATAPRDNIYMATHDGNIYTSHMGQAHPPLVPPREGSTPSGIFPELYSGYIASERKRIGMFIQHSVGCVDFRDITAVERVPGSSTASKDRCFQIKLRRGEVVILEAHSEEAAGEWVQRLRDQMAYWTPRHRVDARERLDITRYHQSRDPFAGTDLARGSDEILGSVWDWCTIRGCRPITIAGRVYMKKSPTERYRQRYVVVTEGMMVMFKINSKHAFHQRKKRYSLFGSYVYSGSLAHDELQSRVERDSVVEPMGRAPRGRRYGDELKTADVALDTMFCIRLPVTSSGWGQKRTYQWEARDDEPLDIPSLSKAAPTILLFRARSKLEKERWIWAINAEMERMVREHPRQEEALRNHGRVPERAIIKGS